MARTGSTCSSARPEHAPADANPTTPVVPTSTPPADRHPGPAPAARRRPAAPRRPRPAPRPPARPPRVCAITFADVPVGSTFYTSSAAWPAGASSAAIPAAAPGEPAPAPTSARTTMSPAARSARSSPSRRASPIRCRARSRPSRMCRPAAPSKLWIERLAGRGIIGGYPCGGPGEPCVAPGNRPYFRPNANVTRGQLAKIVSGAAGWTETPTGQTFADVPPGSTFYLYIERRPAGGSSAAIPAAAPGNRASRRPTGPTSAPTTTRRAAR